MLIYKVLRAEEWDAFERDGATPGAPVDLADGFIHFSTAGQLPGTLQKHFAGETDLMLVAVDANRAGASLHWEPARGRELFPHLYRPLARADVVWARRLDDPTAPPDLA